jgi:Fe2+ or Zn2+ uptake regulation protein
VTTEPVDENLPPAEGVAGGLHDVVEDRLRRADQRYTTGRRAIIDLLVAAGQPVSIGDIAGRLPSLPRSSAYRHLVDLGVAGVVRRVAANDEFARFELAEDLTEHHHHLLCTHCGKVIDVTPAAAFERTVAKTVIQLAEAEGFQPHSHRLDVLGFCADCR